VKWSRRSSHSIQSGEWTISRTRHEGKDLFTLWRQSEAIGICGTADEAKARAKRESAA
jgi:hypothetical protein|tara:strand:- start:434 stop:607 length:174 start_codon:yes stop_codon:yes gene_type:complete